jgi:hypothetical protein
MASKKLLSLDLIPKAEVYKLPSEGYFADAESRILDQAKLKLNSITATNIYVVPDEFFAKQREQILANTTQKRLSIWPSSRSVWSMAAGLVILGVLLWLSLPQRQIVQEDSSLAMLTQAEITRYISDQPITIDDLSTIELGQTDLDNLTIDHLPVNNEDIESYLLESNENLDL